MVEKPWRACSWTCPFGALMSSHSFYIYWYFFPVSCHQVISILVNSMPDEHTNSNITWFNTPLRGNQEAQTLIQVRHGKHEQTVPLQNWVYRPVVKFRNIEESALQAVQLEPDNSEGTDSMDVESDSESVGDEIPIWMPPFLRGQSHSRLMSILTSPCTLRNMVAVDHSVKQSAAPQTSTRLHNTQEKTSVQPDWDW